MTKIRVGVVRGGISSEYEVSLKTGGHVLSILRDKLFDKYNPVDVLITRDGLWHANGVPISRDDLASHIDIAFNALHGEYGEDGRLQSELEHLRIPFTGSESKASEIGMNKSLTKHFFKKSGIKTARHIDIHWKNITEDTISLAHRVHRLSPAPWIVKPIFGGSSIGIRVAKTFPDLVSALMQARDAGSDVLVEEFIIGREATVGVVEGLRGRELYPLFPIEIRKPPDDAWHYDKKYDGSADEICPGAFSEEQSQMLMENASAIHRALGLRHYSRSDFIVTPRAVYALEVNTLPGLTEHSLLPKALLAAGVSSGEFIDHLIALALSGR